MATRILLTGGKGMLARTLIARWGDFDVIPTDLPEADITRPESIDAAIAAAQPDVVIHAAAMTAVDACESAAEGAMRVNGEGSGNVAAACRRHGARLIAISTDYVFRGDADRPYTETDTPDPLTVYGRSKYAGELAVQRELPNAVIARIAWLYGPGGPSFVHTLLKLADGSRPELKVVDDQIGNPTSTLAVADGLKALILRPELSGIFHLTCEGETTWYGLARELFAQAGINQRVVPCTTAEYPRPAPRPANSRLAKDALRRHGLPPMPDWRDALTEFLRVEPVSR